MSAETILKLIEAVDPSDTVAMYEIDARVHSFIHNNCFRKMGDGRAYYDDIGYTPSNHVSQYTRSRDALKNIRPDICAVDISTYSNGKAEVEIYLGDGETLISSPKLPTEELAEIHVIIQAIAYERKGEAK